MRINKVEANQLGTVIDDDGNIVPIVTPSKEKRGKVPKKQFKIDE